MTRDELINKVNYVSEFASMSEDTYEKLQEIKAHDAEQRQTITMLTQRVQELEKALMSEEFPNKHLIETRRCYHERNRVIRQHEATITTLRKALEGFTNVYKVLYNVDQVYATTYEPQQDLERYLRESYRQAQAALERTT